MSTGREGTPAEAFRHAIGYREPAELVTKFADELPERRELTREFYHAWGLVDAAGRFTHEAELRAELAAEHRSHLDGSRWISVSDAEATEIVRVMKAAAAAERIAASAVTTGPGEVNPSFIAAQERMRTATLGVPGASY